MLLWPVGLFKLTLIFLNDSQERECYTCDLMKNTLKIGIRSDAHEPTSFKFGVTIDMTLTSFKVTVTWESWNLSIHSFGYVWLCRRDDFKEFLYGEHRSFERLFFFFFFFFFYYADSSVAESQKVPSSAYFADHWPLNLFFFFFFSIWINCTLENLYSRAVHSVFQNCGQVYSVQKLS